MIKNLANPTTTGRRALLYILLALPLLVAVNGIAHPLTRELGSMPGVTQGLMMLAGAMSLYVLAAKPSWVRNR